MRQHTKGVKRPAKRVVEFVMVRDANRVWVNGVCVGYRARVNAKAAETAGAR